MANSLSEGTTLAWTVSVSAFPQGQDMGRPDVIAPDCCNLQIRGLNTVGDKSDIGTDSASFFFFIPLLEIGV